MRESYWKAEGKECLQKTEKFIEASVATVRIERI
jgi:hypothetical protein